LEVGLTISNNRLIVWLAPDRVPGIILNYVDARSMQQSFETGQRLLAEEH